MEEKKNNKIEQLKLDTQDVIINILKDSIEDNKHIIKRLQITVVLLACLLVGTFIYYEWSFKAFMSQYDYTNEVTQEFQTNGETNGSVNISDINKNSTVKK